MALRTNKILVKHLVEKKRHSSWPMDLFSVAYHKFQKLGLQISYYFPIFLRNADLKS